MPEHGIRTGDIVIVSEQPAGSAKKREVKELEAKGSRGVVTRTGRNAVWVALDGEEDEGVGSKRLWLVKLANDVTYKRFAIPFSPLNLVMHGSADGSRMNQTMGRLQKMREDEYSSFVRVLFGLSSTTPVEAGLEDLEWIDASLNDSQKDAIRFSLASREVALIHGPPGVSFYLLWLFYMLILDRPGRLTL